MKWLFALLVLLNLGLWMWANWYRQTPEEESRAAREPVAPEKIRLLNEPGAKLVPRKSPLTAGASLMSGTPTGCFQIGPFSEEEIMAQGESHLRELDLTYSRRTEEQQVITGFLVYLPPLPSQQAAENKRQELTRMGFRDHALMSDEGMQHAISLGVFAVEANAEARVRELAAKKIEVRLKPFEQARKRHWLNVAARNSPDALEKIRQINWGSREIELRETACLSTPGSTPDRLHESPDNAPN